MEAKPKNSPREGSSIAASWWSSSTVVTRNHARDHDVGAATRFAQLVNSLTGGKLLDLNPAGQNRGFFIVE
jgi:hypothetical protein